MEYICDICGTRIEKTSGYSYTTTQVATSLGYWRWMFEQNRSLYGGDGSAVAPVVMLTIPHTTPWIVCETCSSLVSADREAAHRHASADAPPPGCGPAEQMPAAMAAAYAWSLLFDEWPVSVQLNQNPVTHDPKKGTRCDFCRRILYGDEKFGIFHKEMYEKLVADGARFIRTPSPCITDKDDNPLWVACMNCLNHSQSGSPAPASAPAPARSKRPWWKFWA